MNVKRSEPSRPLSTKDWVPDQPGAWALALLPALAGMVVGGFDAGRLWLTGAWLLCYCVQFTAARWLRSRFQRRYLPPMLTYTALLAIAGVPLLAMHPLILMWAPLYAVLLALACAVPGGTLPLPIIATALLLRAVAMPLLGRRIRIKPIAVGLLEMVLSVAVCAYAPFCAPWISMALTF